MRDPLAFLCGTQSAEEKAKDRELRAFLERAIYANVVKMVSGLRERFDCTTCPHHECEKCPLHAIELLSVHLGKQCGAAVLN